MIGQYIEYAERIFVVLALLFIGWWIYHTGGDNVKIKDLKGVQVQLEANAKQVDAWKQQAAAAEVKHDQEVQLLSTTIASQRAPLIVYRQANPSGLPSNPSRAESTCPVGGGVSGGPGAPIDLRPGSNGLELKYGTALADCRAALASWPHR